MTAVTKPKVRLHKGLEKAQVAKPTTSVEVLGTTYHLELLKPEGEEWVSSRTEGDTLSGALLNMKLPTIAAALTHIDFGDGEGRLPVEALFALGEGLDSNFIEYLQNNPKQMRSWRREQVLEWVREELDIFVVETVAEAYFTLLKGHKKKLGDMRPLSKGTPSPA